MSDVAIPSSDWIKLSKKALFICPRLSDVLAKEGMSFADIHFEAKKRGEKLSAHLIGQICQMKPATYSKVLGLTKIVNAMVGWEEIQKEQIISLVFLPSFALRSKVSDVKGELISSFDSKTLQNIEDGGRVSLYTALLLGRRLNMTESEIIQSLSTDSERAFISKDKRDDYNLAQRDIDIAPERGHPWEIVQV